MSNVIDFLLTYPNVLWCLCIAFLIGALLGAYLQFSTSDKKSAHREATR